MLRCRRSLKPWLSSPRPVYNEHKIKLRRSLIRLFPIQTSNDQNIMKMQILTLAAAVAVLVPAHGADFVVFHERMVNNLKALRNKIVPPPGIDFVETFPPI